jgi:ABC-type protease/lipase transport system fused ATPase/permease subunit
MSQSPKRKTPAAASSPVAGVLKSSRRVFIGVAAMSGIVNLLMLTGSLFMMQVYDRVLGSQSVPTLVALSLIAAAAYIFQGILDIVRTRVISLIAERIDEELGPKIHAAVADLPLRLPRGAQETLQPFRDLDAIRMFVAGPGPLALFDIPWLPIYLTFLFLLHPLLGYLTVFGTLVLIGILLRSRVKVRPRLLEMQRQHVILRPIRCNAMPKLFGPWVCYRH